MTHTHSEEQQLRRSESVYMHDYVTLPNGESGCVVGINTTHGEALINIYEDGDSTMRITPVNIELLVQHPKGRAD